MKKLLCAFFCTALLLLTSCGGDSQKTMDMTAFSESVLSSVEYDDELISLSDKVAGNYYDLEIDGLEGYVIFVSSTSATTNELAVFHCADSSALEATKSAVEARMKDQREAYENYIPDELLRLDNALVKTSGNYLLFSVSDDNETVEKLFDEALK